MKKQALSQEGEGQEAQVLSSEWEALESGAGII